MTAKRHRDRRKALGRCILCCRPPKPGCVQCVPCLRRLARNCDGLHLLRRALGRCWKCGKRRPAPGRSRCRGCLRRARLAMRRRRAAARRLDVARVAAALAAAGGSPGGAARALGVSRRALSQYLARHRGELG